MSIKTYRPTTPARRQMTVSGFDGVDKHAKPEKSLTEVLKKKSGRNSYGRITVRHKGGGNRQKYRVIDFKAKLFASSTTPTAAHSLPLSSTKTASCAISSLLSA